MKKAIWLLAIMLGILLPGRIGAQAPSNGLVLWLQGDKGIIADSKGLDSVWQDQSGNGIDASQTNTSLRPSIVKHNINGVPALHFGNGTFLNAPSRFPVNSSYTVVSVVCAQNLNIYSHILSGVNSRMFWLNGSPYPTFSHGGQSLATSARPVANSFCTLTTIANDSIKRSSIFVNGKNGAVAGYKYSNTDSAINIGAFGGYNTFEGDISEVLVYNRALDSSELSAINVYLNHKYGINLPPDSDINLNHFPAHLQFFQRDSQDSSVVKIDGQVVKKGYDSAAVEVLKNGVRTGYFSQPLSYNSGKAWFTFQPKIHAEMSEYSFKVHLRTGNSDTVAARETGIVSGDSYIICGQSNAVAESYGSTYMNEYVRSFGSLTGYNTYTTDDTAWGYANGNYYVTKGISFIGGIGIQLAQNLLKNYKIPLCIINGAVGGGPIEVNLRNNSNPTDLTTIYGRLLYRMRKSGLDTCAKGLFWYHGAGNTITNYYQNFISLYKGWKADYKNVKKFYVMQIRPSICGAGTHLALRELQRTLQDTFHDITTLSVNNAPGHDGCHFNYAGYDTIGNWISYLFAKDFYQSSDTLNIKPPNIEKAFYDTGQSTVKITFKEKNAGISWSKDVSVWGKNYNIKDAFYLDDVNGLVKSVSVSGDTLMLNLYKPHVFNRVTYIPDHYYEGTYSCYEGPWLINKRGIGAFAFYEFPVVVIPQIKANFHAAPICLGQSYYFQDSSSVNNGSIINAKWFFGDGDSSGLAKVSHTFTRPGQYQVKLVVQSNSGVKDSITRIIKVSDVPDADFKYQFLSEHKVRFSPADSLQSAYKWDFGDGGISRAAGFVYSYASDGSYNVGLTVTNANGCQSSVTKPIQVQPILKAGFVFAGTCLGSITGFKDFSTASSGSISAWVWDFGDSTFSQLQNPRHIYRMPGKYRVKLTVTNKYYVADTISQLINIIPLPVADFSWTKLPDRTVQFQPEDTATGSGYAWAFGDGNTSSAKFPLHVYSVDGNYTAKLKVTSGTCAQTRSSNISIVTPPSTPPTLQIPKAAFSFTATCLGSTTVFTDRSSIDSGSITGWLWNFGDNSVSSEPSPEHLFSHPGAFKVQLKVSGSDGKTDSISRLVSINPLPDAGFSANLQGRELSFSANDTALASYNWTFGDGSEYSFPGGSHMYGGDGKYNIALAVKDSNGCNNQYGDSIEILSAGIAENHPINSSSSINIFPNPFYASAQISIETKNASDITITVYDVTGHLISEIANCHVDEGVHNYTLDAGNTNLAAGLYIVKIRNGNSLVSRQLIKLRD